MRLDIPTLSVSLSNSVLYLIMKAGLSILASDLI